MKKYTLSLLVVAALLNSVNLYAFEDKNDDKSETLFLDSLKEKAKDLGGKIIDKGKDLLGKGVETGKVAAGKAAEVAKQIADNVPWNKIWKNVLHDGVVPALKGCLVGGAKAVPGAVAATVAGTPISGLGVIAGSCTIAAAKASAPGFAKTVFSGVADTVRLTKLDSEIKDNEADIVRLENVSSDAFSFVMENPDLDKTVRSKIDLASSEILQASAEAKGYIKELKKAYDEIKAPVKK